VYRFFDLSVDSELALPALVEVPGGRSDWSIVTGETGPGFDRFHSWKTPDGSELMWVGRKGASYLLAFPGLAWFEADFTSHRIVAEAGPSCDDRTLAHLLLDQVLPRAFCHEGRCVLHASAVEIGGAAVAFTGVSGSGKSTLAAAFYQAGYPVLGDDCLLVEAHHDEAQVLAAYPSLRLWRDSASALFDAGEQIHLDATAMAAYSEKQVLRPRGAGPPSFLPLRALCVLDSDSEAADCAAVTLEPARGQSDLMSLIEAQFTLDVVGRESVVRNFETVRRVANRIPMARLRFPRKYDQLGRVIETVVELAGAVRAAKA
jgi:energy-coupling factor transporter ATP-binding protein EcfA2